MGLKRVFGFQSNKTSERDMRTNFQKKRICKKTAFFTAGMIVLTMLVFAVSVFRHYSGLRFFQHHTGVSLAPLEKIRVTEKATFTGYGWVEISGRIPRDRIDRFIADNSFVQFDIRYAGTYSPNWNAEEYALWLLQERVFGIPPLRYRRFSTVPKTNAKDLPPDSNDYFSAGKGEAQWWYMVLEKLTGMFHGRIFYH